MSDDESRVKKLAEAGNVAAALKLAKKMYEKNPTHKWARRIKKMENHIEIYGEESDEDEDEDMMVCLGNDYYLYQKLYARLYAYQIDGIRFLWKLYQMKKGGVIADDMGLGKTIQIIGFLSGMFDMEKIKTVLIVLPVSLIPNWEKEFEEWGPGIKVLQFYGTKSIREGNLNKIQRRGGVLLTSYGLVRSQSHTFTSLYGKYFKWDYVILDEAHAIKNPTKTTKALHQIDSCNRIALSGTPLQNNLCELWSLFDYVHSGTLLGTLRTFKIEYETPIVRSRQKDATSNERYIGEKMAENLLKKIEPFFLRRTKAQVLKECEALDESGSSKHCKPKALTQKNDFIVWLYLTPLQQKLYEDFIQLDEVRDMLMTRKSPLVQLTVMKKICDHPRILPRNACQSLGFDNLNASMGAEEAGRSIVDGNLDQISSSTLLSESNKIKFTLELAKELKCKGHRILIFSQHRRLLNIVQKVLIENGFRLLRLDGSVTDLNDRARRVEKFQTNSRYDVFLLTTKVGGVGLTLTAADRVIIMDPSWNPSVDNQAVDRAFRIGQKKPVVIYRLITCSTVEEKIYRRQIFKESINRQAVKDAHDPFRYFTQEELKSLFVLEDVRYSKTQKQLEEMHMGQRVSSSYLDEHIAFLHSLDIFGLSDHDLMFSVDEAMTEECSDTSYAKEVVAKAENKLKREIEYVENLMKTQGGGASYTDYTHRKWNNDLWPTRENKKDDDDSDDYDAINAMDVDLQDPFSTSRVKGEEVDNSIIAATLSSGFINTEDDCENSLTAVESSEFMALDEDSNDDKENVKPTILPETGISSPSRKGNFPEFDTFRNGSIYVSESEDEDVKIEVIPQQPKYEEITIHDSLEDLFASSIKFTPPPKDEIDDDDLSIIL